MSEDVWSNSHSVNETKLALARLGCYSPGFAVVLDGAVGQEDTQAAEKCLSDFTAKSWLDLNKVLQSACFSPPEIQNECPHRLNSATKQALQAFIALGQSSDDAT